MFGELPRGLAEDALWAKLPPPLLSVLVIGLAFGFEYLLGIHDSDGSQQSRDFVGSVPWTVWRSVSAVALVVFLLLTVQAVRVLQAPSDWGFHPERHRRRNYLLTATGAAVTIALYRLTIHGDGPRVPVDHLDSRTNVVMLVALVPAVPWLAVVWLAHAECRDLNKFTRAGNEFANAMQDTRPNDPELYRNAVKQLQNLWELLVLCAGAFTLGVVAAVASSGALRGAYVALHPTSNDFPPANVLLYGGLFALALAVIAVPMATAWRNQARKFVDHVYPLPENGRPTVEWVEDRDRLERVLHLDVPFVRNPLTVVGVLAPLVVSALAAFLPEIAN
jgi:hypothetical protein